MMIAGKSGAAVLVLWYFSKKDPTVEVTVKTKVSKNVSIIDF